MMDVIASRAQTWWGAALPSLLASASAATVLSYLFPKDAQFFADKANEAALATFDASVHFQMDEDAGFVQGRAVAGKVLARAMSDGAQ